MKKQLQGIALILFGILLGISGETINDTLLSSLDSLPFDFFGICIGIVGLVFMFLKEKNK